MIVLLLALLVGAVWLVIASVRSDGWMNGLGVFLVGFLVALFTIVCLIDALVNNLSVGGDIARIEAVRAAARDIGPAFGHDIYGQVSDANATIAENQFYHHRWWASFMVPAAWDTVARIQLPGSK